MNRPRLPFGHGLSVPMELRPMAFNPISRLVYIPTMNLPASFTDKGINLKAWRPKDVLPKHGTWGVNFNVEHPGNTPLNVGVSSLSGLGSAQAARRLASCAAGYLEWRPSRRRGGNLVFQGRCDGKFAAYAADSGQELWSFDAQAGVHRRSRSPTKAAGRQYVSVLAGFAGVASGFRPSMGRAHTAAEGAHVLCSVATRSCPPHRRAPAIVPVHDPEFKPNATAEERVVQPGGTVTVVFFCHGVGVAAGGQAP